MRKGFTLVELSIVLVIIGLLIGGILAAQSMIASSRIQKAVKTLQQFDTAVSNFQVKYNSLPGDTKLMTPSGDGDGEIEDASQNFWGYMWQFTGEIAQVWPHLQMAGFMASSPTFVSTVATNFATKGLTPNSPELPWKNTGVVAYQNNAFAPNQHAWLLGDFTNVFTSGNLNLNWPASMASIPAEDALALDAKLDDGAAGTGRISNQNASCATSGVYNVEAGAKCNLFVSMFLSIDREQNN